MALKNRYFIWIALPIFWAIGQASMAAEGPGGTGGGDEVGVDFQMAFFESLGGIQKNPSLLRGATSSAELVGVFQEARVLVVSEKLTVSFLGVTQESAATNDLSTKVVKVNRQRWSAIMDRHLKQAIALHEILSLKGLESTGVYTYSAAYAAPFGLNSAHIRAGSAPVSSFLVSCKDSSKFLDTEKKRELEVARTSFALAVQWRFRDKIFRLASYFLNDDELYLQPVLDQSKVEVVQANDEGVTKKSQNRVFSLSANGSVQNKEGVSETFAAADGKVWDVTNGKRGAFQGTREFRSAGGTNYVHSEVEPESMEESQGIKLLKSERDCTEANVPAVIFDGPKPQLVEEMVSTFDQATKDLWELERADAACQADCAKPAAAYSQAMQKAELAWKNLVPVKKLNELNLAEARQADERRRMKRAHSAGPGRDLRRSRGVSDETQRRLDCLITEMNGNAAVPGLGSNLTRGCRN